MSNEQSHPLEEEIPPRIQEIINFYKSLDTLMLSASFDIWLLTNKMIMTATAVGLVSIIAYSLSTSSSLPPDAVIAFRQITFSLAISLLAIGTVMLGTSILLPRAGAQFMKMRMLIVSNAGVEEAKTTLSQFDSFRRKSEKQYKLLIAITILGIGSFCLAVIFTLWNLDVLIPLSVEN